MNVAFLANSFHLTKTKSSDFFIQLLTSWYGDVAVVPRKEAWARLPGTKWDLLVVWQGLPRPDELESWGALTTVLVPMYDDCPKDRDSWVPYLGFKILCFSRTLGADLATWGHECLTVQYFQEVPGRSVVVDPWALRGFFWPRTAKLTWNHVRPLLGTTPWASFHLHVTSPDGEVTVEQADRQRFALRETAWFEHPEDFQNELAQASVFFAPRRSEGIGQAVLEALALGLCVVAPDAPTMNEYLEHGRTGLLFDPDHPEALDFSRVAEIASAGRRSAVIGRAHWEESIPLIRRFFEDDSPRRTKRWHPLVSLRGCGVATLRALYRRWKKATHG